MASVFVGNLAWETDDQTLLEFFGNMGGKVVSAEVQMHESGRSKGWGLVTFQDAGDAAKAIELCNNTELDGRSIIVREDRGRTRPRASNQREKKVVERDEQEDTKGEEDSAPSCKLFVGNLRWETTDELLSAPFENYGKVVSAEVMMKPDGRSRGWGLVEMSTVDEASLALEELDASELDGRTIKVEFQRPRAPRAKRAPRSRARVTEEVPANKSVFVGNLPWTFSDDDLAKEFPAAVDCEIMQGFDGRSRGYGIVTFETMEEAGEALQLNGTEMVAGDGTSRRCVIRYDRGSARN